MPTTNNLRKGLNRKQWELCNPLPVTSANGACANNATDYRNQVLYLSSGTVGWLYTPEEDGSVQIANPSLSGTFGTGTCIASNNVGPTGTATGGSTTTIQTNLTLARNLKGYRVLITGGTNVGEMRTILQNTVGTNSTITIDGSAYPTAITATSTYRLYTPRWYVINGGSVSAGNFKFYCFALNTWSANLSVTGFATSNSNDSKLVATPSFMYGDFRPFATGTATAGAASTITNAAKNWSTNQWANYQIRITSGTGAGQIRTIASNTATVITVASNWTTNPDDTSEYAIEGNDDFLYFTGAASSNFYRYSISGNSWTTLTARPTATNAGSMSANWVFGSTDASFTDENNIINGRRIYSFLGNTTSTLHYYDIPSNSWVTVSTYAPQLETFGIGTKYVYSDNFIYILMVTNSQRCLRYNVVLNDMEGWHHAIFPNGSAANGESCFIYRYIDGATAIRFVYLMQSNTATLIRSIII